MAKKLVGIAKFHVPGGKATPAPPVGTSLGQFGINLGQFTSQFNDRTKGDMGLRIPVVVRCYDDRSFEFDAKSPHSVDLLKKAAGVDSGSGNVPKVKVGKVTKSQIEEIVNRKMADLNARSVEEGCRLIEGTARSMGLEIVEG